MKTKTEKETKAADVSWVDQSRLHDMKTGDHVVISGKAMALGRGEIKSVHRVTGDLEILPDGGRYTQVVGWKCCHKTDNAELSIDPS